MSHKYDRAQLEAFGEDASEIINEWERTCIHAVSTPPAQVFDALLRCAHNLKGNAGLMGFDKLTSEIHRLEDRLLVLKKDEVNPSAPALLSILFEVERFVRKWLRKLIDTPDYLPDNFNVISKLEAWHPGVSDESKPGENEVAIVEFDSNSFAEETVRIPAGKLDSLIQLVGEMILAQAIVSRGKADDSLDTSMVRDAIGLCDKLVRNLRLTVLDMRMLPMAVIYNKMERAGMEVSIALQKPIRLVFEGQEVSVDKAVLNRIFDPLMHILRNAIDHGLETQQVRQAAGKARAGTIVVSSTIEPGGVCIRVRDDGSGLDLEKIRSVAIARGMIQADQELPAERIQNLIFEPGFSTAKSVTNISGRGVGMDVVKREVINLGGQVDLSFVPGKSTEFALTIPITISLIEAFVIVSGDQLYCVPTQDVVEVLEMSEVKIEKSAMYQRMIQYRDRVVPIEPVESFLHHANVSSTFSDKSGFVLIVSYSGKQIGIRVDVITHQQQVFVRSLQGYLKSLPGLTGSTILSNGEPSLIINVKEMANQFFSKVQRGESLGEHSI